ncbi:immunoglobulin E-set [Pisolithus croceorrhizus]|nr:immunoglobulin E-set [Pisolithus sp. B1]KAI6128464.1 immunoglobulin E-set [Pisolithus croceorrhizus]
MVNANLHDVELVWPHVGPNDVIVTGTFDQWSASIHLVKGDTGFRGMVKLPWGEKVAYKFIVDGYWSCRDDQPMENDGSGNINNILYVPQKPLPPPGEIVSVPEATHPPEPNGMAPVVPMTIVPVNDATSGRPLPSSALTAEPITSEQPNGPSTHTPAQSEVVTESPPAMPSSDVCEGTENQNSRPLNAAVTSVVPETTAEQRAVPSSERHTSLPAAVQQNPSLTAPSMESSVTVKKKRLSIFEKLKRVFHKGKAEQRQA